MEGQFLCRIRYFIDEQKSDNDISNNLDQEIKHSIDVIVGMSTYQIAECLGKELGCGYQEFIQIQIRNQLENVIKNGDGGESWKQCQWRKHMQEVLDSFGRCSNQLREYNKNSGGEDGIDFSQQKRKSPNYFQINYQKCFRNQTQKRLQKLSRENSLGIYQRSIKMKKRREQKLQQLKKSKQVSQLSVCTFTPNINDTQQYFNKKNPKFFNENEYKKLNKQNRFEKLYKQSIDLREKKKLKIKILQNQQYNKYYQFNFIPNINQCSKQICKIKNYKQLYHQHIGQLQSKSSKHIKSNNLIKKQKTKQIFTFQPQLSKNTKKLTQHLPSFYQRLQFNKKQQKKQQKQKQKQKQKIALKKQNIYENKKIKKQFYTIDNNNEQTNNQKKTQKKQISPNNQYHQYIMGISQFQKKQLQETCQLSKHQSGQNKTSLMFNQRKKYIFQTIFKFLTIKPQITLTQFSIKHYAKQNHKNLQVNIHDITDNPNIPKFIKQLFSPISIQLGQLQITLNLEQFLWAIDKLFQGLDVVDRGCLLGWGVKLLPESNN